MNELFADSVFFGFALTLVTYWIGVKLAERFSFPLFNPLLISTILIIIILLTLDIDVETYNKGASYLNFFLTPATVCLSVPLYRKLQVLKDNLAAILAGVLSGCITSGVTIFLFCKFCNLDEILYRSMLPKSITTAMGLGVSEKLGGMPSVTMMGIMIAGFTGAILSPTVFKLFHINDPIAQGLAIGTSSHALGTSKAVQLGDLQGAVSGLAIVVAGVITVVLAPIMAGIW